jgi:hypothetical protein
LPAPHPASDAIASTAQAAKAAIRRKLSSSDQSYNSGAVVTELAEGSVAEHVGELTALFGFPITRTQPARPHCPVRPFAASRLGDPHNGPS